VKTIFVGAYGFGNLGDELVLMEAMRAFPSREAWVRSVTPEHTGRFVECAGFVPWEPACPPPDFRIDFERLVIGGGGILNGPPAHDYMKWVVAAQRSGAETYVHNVGASGPNDPSWITPDIADALERLDGFTVRDEDSLAKFKGWGVKREIGRTEFPETYLEPDFSLAAELPDGPILGVSVNNGGAFFAMVRANQEKIAEALAEFRGMPVLPIVSTVHRFSEQENDIEGFKRFAGTFFPDAKILMPETLDRGWWYENMSPARLKGLIARCATLVSRRKHNCVHAIAAGVRAVGLSRREDYGVQSVFDVLASRLPPGSASLRF
jgi:hypothetical protein